MLFDMIYSSRDMERDGLKLAILDHFLLLHPHNGPKNEDF